MKRSFFHGDIGIGTGVVKLANMYMLYTAGPAYKDLDLDIERVTTNTRWFLTEILLKQCLHDWYNSDAQTNQLVSNLGRAFPDLRAQLDGLKTMAQKKHFITQNEPKLQSIARQKRQPQIAQMTASEV